MRRRHKQPRWHTFLSRREFFTRPFVWLKNEPTNQQESKNIPARIHLNSIRDIPEAVLMRIVPILRHGWSVHVCEKGVSYQDASGQEGMVSLDKEARAAVLLFNGTRALEQVALTLETEFGITPSHSAFIVRETFLKLAMREIYHPSDSIDHLLMSPYV